MAEVNMPRFSDTMQEGTISRWLKHPGDDVKKGDILAEIETDKANMELESYDNGILERILVEEGETVPIGQPIAVVGSGASAPAQGARAGVDAAQAAAASTADSQQAGKSAHEESLNSGQGGNAQQGVGPQQTQAMPRQERSNAPEAGDGAMIKASPLARRIAEEHGIDLHQVNGTGPGGRIVRDDVEDFLGQNQAATAPAKEAAAGENTAAAPPPAPPPLAQSDDDEVIKLSRMQVAIARRLTESKATIPHFYVRSEVNMNDALTLRQTLNTSVGEEGVKISVNDLIVKACALALEKFPEVNSSYRDGQFIRHKRINVGIAVDVPAGLIVPVIRDANIKGVRSIAREARELIEKARANKLSQSELEGGTFSVSNLGMMQVSDFVAVINPPEAAILAVASTRQQYVPIGGQPVIQSVMPITLSADHRILYGATVARFLGEVRRLLESPYNLLG